MGDNLVDNMLNGYKAETADARMILDVLRVMNSQITHLPCVENSNRISDLEKIEDQRKGGWKVICIEAAIVSSLTGGFIAWLFK